MDTIKPIPTLDVCKILSDDRGVQEFVTASAPKRKEVVELKAKQFEEKYGILAEDFQKITEGLLYFLSELDRLSILKIYETDLYEQMIQALFGGNLHLSMLVPPQPTRRPRRILILGETGCGKTAIAQVLALGLGKAFGAQKMVEVSAADLPDQLLDAALFGHEKGAFTGADKNRTGLLAEADGGVLFIDEIGEASATVQAKLLRVLETGKYRQLGAVAEQESHFHLIAATNRPREELQNSKAFRKDLFFRLADEIIEVPPLRQILTVREEPFQVLENLADHVARREILGIPMHDTPDQQDQSSVADRVLDEYMKDTFDKTIAKQIVKELSGYPWPGNLRECNHFIRKIFEAGGAFQDPQWIQKRCQALKGTTRQASTQPTQQLPTLPVDLRKETENLERQLYVMAAEQSSSIQQVAQLLNVTRQTAARRMGYFKLTPPTLQSRRSTR